jgi:hypothetical protein
VWPDYPATVQFPVAPEVVPGGSAIKSRDEDKKESECSLTPETRFHKGRAKTGARHGAALFYRCNWCQRPCRYLYLLTLSGTKLVPDLGLRCQVCARLRFGSQGQYRRAFSRLWGTRPRYPWDPQAVSDPWLVEEEFRRQRTPAASGVECDDREQGQVAHETPAKTMRTVPLEFKDEATGEQFDVVQGDDPDLPAEPQARGRRLS